MSNVKNSKTSKKVILVEPTSSKLLSNQSTEQLSAIKNLLFGEQVKALEQAIEVQNNVLNKRLDNLEALMIKNTSELSTALTKASQNIVDDLENNRLEHVSQETILEGKLELLNSQLTDYQQATEKEFSQTHSELAQSVKELNQVISKEVDQLTKQIERSSKELGDNKTDRKTLASLLESMASNLIEFQE